MGTRIDGNVAVTRIGARLLGPDEARILTYLDLFMMAALPNALHQLDRSIGPLMSIARDIRHALRDTTVRVEQLPPDRTDGDLLTTFYRPGNAGAHHLTLRLTDHRWKLLSQDDFSVDRPDYSAQSFDRDLESVLQACAGRDAAAVTRAFAVQVLQREGYERAKDPLEWPPPPPPPLNRRAGRRRPMTEERFWAVIERDRHSTKAPTPAAVDRLTTQVERLSDQELADFVRTFHAVHLRAYSWDLWAAGYLIQDTMSDDGFVDFRSWLIAHGRDVFERALADPDTIAELDWRADLEDMGVAEQFADVGVQEYLARIGEPPEELGTFYPDAEPTGEEFPNQDPAWFLDRFPRLAARVGLTPAHRFGSRWGAR